MRPVVCVDAPSVLVTALAMQQPLIQYRSLCICRSLLVLDTSFFLSKPVQAPSVDLDGLGRRMAEAEGLTDEHSSMVQVCCGMTML
jgi:hypothetical protein